MVYLVRSAAFVLFFLFALAPARVSGAASLELDYQITGSYRLAKSIEGHPQSSARFGQPGWNRGLSDQDQRQRLVGGGVVLQSLRNAANPVRRAVANGWQLSTIVGFESVFPFSPTTSVNLTRIGAGDRLAASDASGEYILYGRNSFRPFGRLPAQTQYSYSASAAYTASTAAAVPSDRLPVNPSFGTPCGADSARGIQLALGSIV